MLAVVSVFGYVGIEPLGVAQYVGGPVRYNVGNFMTVPLCNLLHAAFLYLAPSPSGYLSINLPLTQSITRSLCQSIYHSLTLSINII
jgi:hypothetical protein